MRIDVSKDFLNAVVSMGQGQLTVAPRCLKKYRCENIIVFKASRLPKRVTATITILALAASSLYPPNRPPESLSRIGNQMDATFIFARANFVNVFLS